MSGKRDKLAEREVSCLDASRFFRPSGVFGASDLSELQSAFEETCITAGLAAGSAERDALASVFMRLAHSRCRDIEDLKAVAISRARQLGAPFPKAAPPFLNQESSDPDATTAASHCDTAVATFDVEVPRSRRT